MERAPTPQHGTGTNAQTNGSSSEARSRFTEANGATAEACASPARSYRSLVLRVREGRQMTGQPYGMIARPIRKLPGDRPHRRKHFAAMFAKEDLQVTLASLVA